MSRVGSYVPDSPARRENPLWNTRHANVLREASVHRGHNSRDRDRRARAISPPDIAQADRANQREAPPRTSPRCRWRGDRANPGLGRSAWWPWDQHGWLRTSPTVFATPYHGCPRRRRALGWPRDHDLVSLNPVATTGAIAGVLALVPGAACPSAEHCRVRCPRSAPERWPPRPA